MTRAVLFDVMDTVLVDPYRDALAAATAVPLEELFARRDADLWPAFERGELDEAGYWAGWEAAGIVCDPAAFHAARREATRWVPGMRELLDDLAGVVARVAASNYPVWIEELARDHLDGRFEDVVASHHLGVRKPDPAFFEQLLARLDLAPQEVLFVDDRQVNVDGAAALGIAGHRFTDVAAVRSWLDERGVPLPSTAGRR